MIAWRPVVAGDDGADSGPLAARSPHRTNLGREIVVLLGLAVLIAFVVKSAVAQPFYIPSESMYPQLKTGDRVVVSKLAYRLHDPHRGDVVVFDNPHADLPQDRSALPVRLVRGILEAVGARQPSTDEFIKRVVALPGETVEGRDGRVWVDGMPLEEPYLPPGITTSAFDPIEIEEGELWVMGDNRANSSDSRVFGPIQQSSVVGRAIARIWPFGRTAFL